MPGIDSFTKLMLHCDGADASTTFTDSSFFGHTLTASAVENDTAQFKFGPASLLFTTINATLTSDVSADFTWGLGNFTIDFWYRPINSTQHNIFQFGNAGDPVIYKWVDDTINFYIGGNVITGTTVITLNTWNHVALARSSGNTKLFLNGVQEGATYVDGNNYATNLIIIGQTGFSQAGAWVDEVRVSKGVARWTANFTAPTIAYDSYSGFGLSDESLPSAQKMWRRRTPMPYRSR
jgi:hypothetical protein